MASLLVADAINLALLISRSPQWGVYADGQPVIQPVTPISQQFDAVLAPIQIVASFLGVPNLLPVTASIIDFDFRQDWAVANYPVEEGAFASYDKVARPYDIRLRIASSGQSTKRQAFISSVLTIANSLKLFDIVTPETIFTSCSVSRISWPRRPDHGVSLIVAELVFQKIRETGETIFNSTLDPTAQGATALGNVQGKSAGTVTVKSLSGGIR